METEVPPGSILKLDIETRESAHEPAQGGSGMTRVRVLDSEASREQKREAARERTTGLQRHNLAELRVAAVKPEARRVP
jgi:hypothetical protein